MKAAECISVDHTSEVEYDPEGSSVCSNPKLYIISSPCDRVLQVKAGSSDTKEVKPADDTVILEIPVILKQALVGLSDTRSTEEPCVVDEPENLELNSGDLVSSFHEHAGSRQNTVPASQVTDLGNVRELYTSETEPPRQPVKMHLSEASYVECGPSGRSEETSGYTEPDTVDNGCNDVTVIGEWIVNRVQKPDQSEHETPLGETKDSDISSKALDIKQELRQDEQTEDMSDVDWKYQKVKMNEAECDEPIEPNEYTEHRVRADKQESNLTTASNKFTGLELQATYETEPSPSSQSSLSDAALTSFGVFGTPLCNVQGSSSPSDVQPKNRMYTCIIYVHS
jgi:hypothetical protein